MASGLPGIVDLWLAGGKLHPLAVHFPIALLIVGAGLELWRGARKRGPSPTARACLTIGAATAVLAAVLGWSGAETSGHQGTTATYLEVHRWLGVATAGLAVVVAVLAWPAARRKRALSAYRTGAVLTAIAVSAAGHFGGSLVYGPDYLARAWALLRPQTPDGLVLTGEGGRIDFFRHVQPILARRCHLCHAGEEPEAGLALTSRAAMLAGGDSGEPAVVPGSPDASRLIRLVSGLDPDVRMPPKGSPLEPGQIAVLRRWIEQGATWSDAAQDGRWHWAYTPARRVNPPPVRDTYWARTPIDSFVLARLESEGLSPSPESARATLIRRLSLDLTGLPPTPEEVEAFERDERADAYERVVDRLLGSVHYGERWARVWLDLARYADTHGYEKDDRRTMWPYRDWVIDAFNRDLPFDRFTIEQIGGDLLEEPTLAQVVATGFNRNTMINEEGGVDPEEFRADAVVDRVNTISSVWLGSTVGCAQCHDHKFDPIPQRDYFRMYALLNQDDPDVVVHATGAFAAGGKAPWTGPEHRAELDGLWREARDLRRALSTPTAELAQEQQAWEEAARARPSWGVLTPSRVSTARGAGLAVVEGGQVVATGESPTTEAYTLEFDLDPAGLTALRIDVLPEATTPTRGVGRSPNGNIVLSGIEAWAVEGETQTRLAIARGAADFEQGQGYGGGGVWPASGALDEDPKTGWGIGPRTGEAHAAWFALAEPAPKAGMLRLVVRQEWGDRHTIGRMRVAATREPVEGHEPLAPPVEEALATARGDRTEEQASVLAAHFLAAAPSLAPARARLAEVEKRIGELSRASAMVMKRNATARETHVHMKGNFLAPGEAVEPGVPEAMLAEGAAHPRDRLELAQWLASPENPLTARVAVNRIWEQIYGRGLVATGDDFGTQGDAPTHPELLDWLATEFVRRGWSIKSLVRLIVTSATYRQDSRVTPELLERDPENLLLARAPRYRVEAETVRDIALAASGLLTRAVGGPSVFPPQPEGIWTMIYSSDRWAESTGEDRFRRGLYTFWRRTAPYPTFTAFDAPSREVTCARRARTNTPLQALTTMNDPAFVEAAGALGRRVMAEAGPDARSRVERAFRLVVSRRPTRDEAERLLALHREQLSAFRADPEAAELVAASGPPGAPPGDDPAETAAWHVVCSVILNLDEAITRE